MHQRPTLNSGENGGVKLLRQCLIIGQDHATPWPTQRFVSGGGRRVDVGEGRWVHTRGNQACKVRHIRQEIGPNLVRNRAEPRKMKLARDG